MIALILMRLARARADRRRSADQARVRGLFLEIIAGEAEAEAHLKPFRRRARLMAEALLEVVGLIRGADRERLVDCLARQGVTDRLRRRLSRGRKAGRIAAAEALAVFPDVQTVEALQAALRRARDGDVRVAILTTLLDLEAAPPLRTLLADIAAEGLQGSWLYEPIVRRAAAEAPTEALTAFSDPRLAGDTRAVLANALGAAGDYRAIEALMRGATKGALELRIASIRALGLLRHPAAEPALRAALIDPAWEVRSAACEAAGRIGLVQTTPQLVEALGDPAWWVRFRAGEALTVLGEKGVAALRLAARVDHDAVRRAASLALAERGLSERIP